VNKQQNKKYKLFELFSKNLEFVKEHPKVKFKPDFKNGYICPLCFNVFFEKDLSSEQPNYLTLEDIPPKSLGGKVRALTCKKCNSISGHKLDNHLLKRLTEIDFHSFLPKSKTETTFELNGNKVNGNVQIDETGTFRIDLQTKRSNPIESKQFISDLLPPRTFYSPLHQLLNTDFTEPEYKTETFSFKKDEKSNERRAEIALLRVAYLFAFSLLGNGFFINGYIHKIREQILNPDKKILPRVFWIKYEFPENMIGVNIIKKPKELRSFLIIFNLTTKSVTRQFAICLPGLSEPGLKIYNNLEKMLCTGNGFRDIEVEHIDKKDLLTKKGYEFAASYYWNKIAKHNRI